MGTELFIFVTCHLLVEVHHKTWLAARCTPSGIRIVMNIPAGFVPDGWELIVSCLLTSGANDWPSLSTMVTNAVLVWFSFSMYDVGSNSKLGTGEKSTARNFSD